MNETTRETKESKLRQITDNLNEGDLIEVVVDKGNGVYTFSCYFVGVEDKPTEGMLCYSTSKLNGKPYMGPNQLSFDGENLAFIKNISPRV